MAKPTLFGAKISPHTRSELVSMMCDGRPGRGVRLLVTMNLDHVVRLQNDPSFRDAYARAWMVTIDGAPVRLYSRLKGLKIARCTGADLTVDLVAAMKPQSHRPFFVVSSEAVAQKILEKMTERGFTSDVLAFVSPPMGFDEDEAQSAALCQLIRDHRATHLIFGLGAPKSEIWIDRHRAQLGDLFACSVGSAPDYLAGVSRRAPKVFQRMAMEWAWRVAHEHRRLSKRYFVHSWAFIPAVLRDLGFLSDRPRPQPSSATLNLPSS